MIFKKVKYFYKDKLLIFHLKNFIEKLLDELDQISGTLGLLGVHFCSQLCLAFSSTFPLGLLGRD
jgi:hypothetical protein